MAATRVDSTTKQEPDVHHQDVQDVHQQDAREAEKLGVEIDEVVVTRISEEDLLRISKECLDFHSRTGFYIALITLCMGFNMAGYVQMLPYMWAWRLIVITDMVWIGASSVVSTPTLASTNTLASPIPASLLAPSTA